MLNTAPNVHEFIKRTPLEPWPTTSFLLLNLLGEICWNCSQPIDTSEIGFRRVKEHGIDDLSLMQHGMCPRCGSTRHDMVVTGRYKIPSVANIVLGQRSGKSIILATLAHYYEHRLLSWLSSGKMSVLPAARRHAGVEIMDAHKNAGVYNALRSVFRYIPCEFPDMTADESEDGKIVLARRGDSAQWLSGNSVPRSLPYPWLRVINEAAWGLDSGQTNAESVLRTVVDYTHLDPLRTRLAVFNGMEDVPDLLPVLTVFSSSPKRPGDIADVLETVSMFDSSVFHVKIPTWSFNPSISLEDLHAEFESNAAYAWRDFGCSHMLPPASVVG